jgi:hypothetical protein
MVSGERTVQTEQDMRYVIPADFVHVLGGTGHRKHLPTVRLIRASVGDFVSLLDMCRNEL